MMARCIMLGVLCLLLDSRSPLLAAEKTIRVFIALCDNKTQGIQPVGAKIGDGNVPDENLYWGCTDGFGSYFKQSKEWKLLKAESDVSDIILRRMTLKHVSGDFTITAEAYRGSAIKKCLEDFEMATNSSQYDLVAFIGHNGLMDFRLDQAKDPEIRPKQTDAMVLCCVSDKYFRWRLERYNARPVLTTQQLMYPGSFILHDALEVWMKGGSPEEMRTAAARAYARNQKISVKAAAGIFASAAVKASH